MADDLATQLLTHSPTFDDRTKQLLTAAAGRRDAEQWNDEDAQNVISFLLQQLDAHHHEISTKPAALKHQACLVSKTGNAVTIDCDDAHEANELFDWLIN